MTKFAIVSNFAMDGGGGSDPLPANKRRGVAS